MKRIHELQLVAFIDDISIEYHQYYAEMLKIYGINPEKNYFSPVFSIGGVIGNVEKNNPTGGRIVYQLLSNRFICYFYGSSQIGLLTDDEIANSVTHFAEVFTKIFSNKTATRVGVVGRSLLEKMYDTENEVVARLVNKTLVPAIATDAIAAELLIVIPIEPIQNNVTYVRLVFKPWTVSEGRFTLWIEKDIHTPHDQELQLSISDQILFFKDAIKSRLPDWVVRLESDTI